MKKKLLFISIMLFSIAATAQNNNAKYTKTDTFACVLVVFDSTQVVINNKDIYQAHPMYWVYGFTVRKFYEDSFVITSYLYSDKTEIKLPCWLFPYEFKK